MDSVAITRKVVLVDDHHLVRAGLRALLDDIPGYEVVAEGADGSEAARLLDRFRPDILMMDIAMPRKSGLDVLPDIVRRFPDIPVILLSMHASCDYFKEAFESGAMAYLVKDSAEAELEMALTSVEKGEKYISPKVSQCLIDTLSGEGEEKPETDPDIPLTDRQIEILRLIALGKSTKEIAYELDLSAKTVETHRAKIMDRLEIRDVANLVRYAIRHQVISLEE
ncbi:MAG: response regulator transcription factor [Ketobacteraceae bacterium]|nr:response regulator transcription factor [Ketobacteraceae bacterium]